MANVPHGEAGWVGLGMSRAAAHVGCRAARLRWNWRLAITFPRVRRNRLIWQPLAKSSKVGKKVHERCSLRKWRIGRNTFQLFATDLQAPRTSAACGRLQ
jgi:hypothetical protein